MKNYLAVYMGSASGQAMNEWTQLDEATRHEREKAGMAAWSKWVEKNRESIVADGSPLGKTKCVDVQGVSDIKNRLAAYTIVQADSHAAAAKLFEKHPHFTIFPGESVEIMECLPIPKM